MIWSGSDTLYSFQSKITSELSFVQLQNKLPLENQAEQYRNLQINLSLLCGIIRAGVLRNRVDSFSSRSAMTDLMTLLSSIFVFRSHFLENQVCIKKYLYISVGISDNFR